MGNTRLWDPDVYDSLCSSPGAGRYSFTTNLDSVPSSLTPFVQSSEPDTFRGLLYMGSSTSHAPPSIGGVQPAPNAPVFRVRRFRADEDASGPHANVDDSLIFPDASGTVWKRSWEDRDDHYRRLSADTGLGGVLNPYSLTSASSSGSIEDLRRMGVLVGFAT